MYVFTTIEKEKKITPIKTGEEARIEVDNHCWADKKGKLWWFEDENEATLQYDKIVKQWNSKKETK